MKQATVRHGIPALTLLALIVPALAVAGRLPDPIAVHWTLGGTPNGHAPWWVITGGAAVLWLAAWAAVARDATSAVGVYALGGILLAAHSAGLWANFDAPTWDRARALGWVLVLGILAAGALGAVVGRLLAPPRRPEYSDELPSAGLRDGEQAVWSGTAHNHVLVAVAPVAAAVAAVLGSPVVWRVAAVFALVALVFSSVRVLVGPTGVRVRVGLLGWPRRTLAYDDIAGAGADRIAPLAHGGWGWRTRPGRTAVVVRAGDGLVLRLRSGATFVVTVDGARAGAGLVNDYVSRHRTPA